MPVARVGLGSLLQRSVVVVIVLCQTDGYDPVGGFVSGYEPTRGLAMDRRHKQGDALLRSLPPVGSRRAACTLHTWHLGQLIRPWMPHQGVAAREKQQAASHLTSSSTPSSTPPPVRSNRVPENATATTPSLELLSILAVAGSLPWQRCCVCMGGTPVAHHQLSCHFTEFVPAQIDS
jgi:hypothetical protein